ncbi:MAG: hypothetical protein K2X27_28625 [Candidatus Obscuribacterales bacterium]|nr:hypothetical protein [Candidatus Obscuribacterales bacterium]
MSQRIIDFIKRNSIKIAVAYVLTAIISFGTALLIIQLYDNVFLALTAGTVVFFGVQQLLLVDLF